MRLIELLDPLVFKVASLGSSAVSGVASVATADWTMGIFGVPLSVFLAGFAGAMISLSFIPPPADPQDRKKTLLGMAGHVASGTVFAAYTEPLVFAGINHYLEPDLPPGLGLGIACVLGAVLMLVIPIGIKWLKLKFGGAA